MKKMRLDLQFFASGSFELAKATGNASWKSLQGKIEWSSVASGSEENQSVVTTKLYVRTWTGGTSGRKWIGSVKVGSNTAHTFDDMGSSWANKDIASTYTLFKTYTDTIKHNDDGTCKVNISASIAGPSGTSIAGVTSSGSKEITLDTIPRATTLDSFGGNKRIGVTNDVIINFTKKSSSFTTTLAYATKSDYSDMTTIVEKSPNASTYAWTLPIELLNKIPNSKTLKIYVRLTTYDGNTQIGNAQTSSFDSIVYEDNCRPVWNTHTIEETDTTAKQLVTTANKFVANLSKPKFTFSAKGQYGATISYYQINNTTRTSGFTDSSFNINGYTLKVIDSRGIENTYKFDLTYVPYFTPIFEEVKLFRDVPTSEKLFSYFKIKFFNNTSSVKFDNPQALSYKFNYQESGGTAQEKAITPEIYDDGTSRYAESETELGNTFNYKKNVDWTFSFIDLTGKTFTTNATLPMGIPLMNGKTEEDGEQVLYINGEIKGEGIEPFIKKDTDVRVSNVVSRNMLDLDKCSFGACKRLGNGLISDVNSYYYCYVLANYLKDWILANKGKTITLSVGKVIPDRYVGIVIFGTFSDGASYQEASISNSSEVSLTISEKLLTIDNFELRFNGFGAEFTDTTTTIPYMQLELGDKATSYVPYLNLEEAMQGPKIKKIYITELMNTKEGFSFLDSNYIFKDRNRYFGDIVIMKNSGVFNSTQDVVATLNKTITKAINSGCFLSGGEWVTTNVGYCYMGSDVIAIADSTNSNCNVAKIHLDIVVDE